MRLKLLFLLLPIFIFSQKIDWQSRSDLNSNSKYHFETSFENFQTSFLKTSNKEIKIRIPVDGSSFENFVFVKQNPFSKELSKKFPDIKIFRGKSSDSDKSAFISFVGQKINISILDSKYKTVIINSKDKDIFILKPKIEEEKIPKPGFENDLIEAPGSTFEKKSNRENINTIGFSTKLKKYRIAILTTAEWSNYFIDLYEASDLDLEGKKAVVISEIGIALSGLNKVTERDLGITFELVKNTDELIEFDTNKDGLTNNDKTIMLGESMKIINDIIEDPDTVESEYDIGHTFYNGGGGLAYLRVLCNPSKYKAGGVSGGLTGVGFYFVFLHEMGHMMGAPHTFNNAPGYGADGNMVESGSGVTIMGYGPRAERNLYYHAYSLKEMNAVIQSRDCGTFVDDFDNAAPVFKTSPPKLSYSIPAGTPFALGEGFEISDANNEYKDLLFNWDQMDAYKVTVNPPLNTSLIGPTFISLFPNDKQIRYFPDIETILAGKTQTEWEVVPQLTRDLNFTFTVRDNNPSGGNILQEDFKVKTNYSSNGTFEVLSQFVQNLKHRQEEVIEVRWNHLASVQTTKVNIELSYDGGYTYPFMLADATLNDGTQEVTIPLLSKTKKARVRVKPTDNIFFGINAVNFEIVDPEFKMNVTYPEEILCFGGLGKLSINPKGGGGAPYTILWEKYLDDTWSAYSDDDNDPKVLSKILAGKYKATVSDKDDNEFKSEIITLTGPATKLDVQLGSDINKEISCVGFSDGYLNVLTSGGSAPYTLFLNDQVIKTDLKKDEVFKIKNLKAGDYLIRVIDGNGCDSNILEEKITEPENALYLKNFDITNPTTDSSDGSIDIEIDGGTKPYSYSWTSSSFNESSEDISDLEKGTYLLVVTDDKGCEFKKEFILEKKEGFNYNITLTQINCFGDASGQIESKPSGGSGAPYTFGWYDENNILLSDSSKLSDVKAGTYELRISDSTQNDFPVKIIEITEPVSSVNINLESKVDIKCKDDSTGDFKISIAGGVAPYSYFINNELLKSDSGDTNNNTDELIQNNLKAGIYNVLVVDSKNCSKSFQVSISEPEFEIKVSNEVVTDLTKFDSNDGSIEFNVTGGVVADNSSYVFSWTGPDDFTSVNQNLSNLKPGTYVVIIKDDNDCSISKEYVIETPSDFSFSSVETTIPKCFNGKDGTISIAFQGGYGSPHVVNWFQKNKSGDFVAISADSDTSKTLTTVSGVYKVEVIDKENIKYQYGSEIIVDSVLELLVEPAFNIIPETCPGDKDGSFNIKIAGGTGPYTYYLNDEIIATERGNAVDNKDEFKIDNLIKKDYVFYAIDANGCVTNPINIFIDGNDPIQVTNDVIAKRNITCFGFSDGEVKPAITGGDGTANFIYSWNGPNGFTSSEKDITNLGDPGLYTLNVTSGPCTQKFEYDVKEPQELIAVIEELKHNVCFGDKKGTMQLKITGGTSPWIIDGKYYGRKDQDSYTLNIDSQSAGIKNYTVTDYYNCKTIILKPKVLQPDTALVIEKNIEGNCITEKSILKLKMSKGDAFINGAFEEYYKLKITGTNFSESLNIVKNQEYKFENLVDGYYKIEVTQRDFLESNDSQKAGCIVVQSIFISNKVIWDNKTISDIKCVNGDVPSDDGKVLYTNIRGGVPIVGEETKKYNYEVIFGETVVVSGSVIQGSNLKIENLKQGRYVINFKGGDGDCVSSDAFIISQPAPISLKINQIYGSCLDPKLDVSKGAINFNVKGGTAPYDIYIIDENNVNTFTGFNGGTLENQNTIGYTLTLNGLNTGKYKIRVKDKNSCEFISDEFSITTLDEFEVLSILTYDVECFGGKNGSIDVGSIKGGAAPYSILLEGEGYKFERTIIEAVDNYIIKDLDKKDYKLTITDKNGWCGTFQKDITIREPELVKINILNIENQKCYDYDDGKIKIDIEGGMLTGIEASYLTKWYKDDVLNSEWNDKLEIDNLGYGFFRIDAIAKSIVNGKEVSCTTSKSFEIIREDRIIASENVAKHVDINCNGGNDGEFELYFIGGAPPYKVVSDGSVVAEDITGNTYLFKNMLSRNYSIDILDSNNCKFSESINDATKEVNGLIIVKLDQPAKLLDVLVSTLNSSCVGSDDGEVIVNVSGGKPPYSINWNLDRPFKELESNPKTGYFKIKTGKGSVFPTVTDVTNFCGSISTNISIEEPLEFKGTEISKVDNICVNGELGEYEFYVNGLNDDIFIEQTISWFKVEGDKIISIDGLKNIIISDDKLKATNLPKGNYLIEIKAKHFRNFEDGDKVECLITQKFEIKDPEDFLLKEVKDKHQNIVCDSTTGSIVLNIEGGNSPYRIQINDDLSQEIILDDQGNYKIENLIKGEYKISVFNNLNCKTAEISTEIIEIFPVFEVSNTSTIDSNKNEIVEGNKPECYNGLGSFYFEISNNQSTLPLKYYLDNTEIFIDKEISFENDGYIINNIEVGTKDLQIIDENGGCRNINFEILNQDKIRLQKSDKTEYIQQFIPCYDEQDDENLNLGIIDVTGSATGGKKYENLDYEYKFNWTGPNFSSKKTKIEVTEPGIYNLIISDAFGCETEKLVFDLSIDPIVANPEIINYSCQGDLGSISIDPSGGKAPYIVQWYKSDKNGELLEFINGQLKIDKLNPGYYTTIIVDNNGCQKIENHKLISEQLFIIEEPVIDDELCLQKTGYLDIKINNPWDTELLFLYDDKELTYTKNNITEDYVLYHVKIEEPLGDANFYVKNEFDCTYKLNLNLGVGVPDFSIIDNKGFVIEDFGKIPFNREITIKNISEGKYYSVSYDLGDGSGEKPFLRDNDQGVSITYEKEGYYNISLKIFNPEGCYKEIRKTILIGKGYWFKAPNAFTPNNDAINDVYRPIIRGFIKGQFNVFSISGIKLHEQIFDVGEDYRKIITLDGWSGDNRINSDKVYHYLFEGSTLDEEYISKSGYFKVLE